VPINRGLQQIIFANLLFITASLPLGLFICTTATLEFRKRLDWHNTCVKKSWESIHVRSILRKPLCC